MLYKLQTRTFAQLRALQCNMTGIITRRTLIMNLKSKGTKKVTDICLFQFSVPDLSDNTNQIVHGR